MQLELHPSLRRFADGSKTLALEETTTVNGILSSLQHHYPKLAKKVLTPDGNLNGYVNIYINGQNLSDLPDEQPLNTNDHVEMITSLVGG